MDLYFLSLMLISYFSGAISSAVIVCRLMMLPDPRIVGSKNPGATNVLRIGGTLAAIITLAGDVAKTFLPVMLAFRLNFSQTDVVWVGISSLIGHCFPIYYHFKGGKGVVTMLTIISLVLPSLALLAIGCWIITAWAFNRSSVASIITALVIPIFINQFNPELLLPISALSTVVFIRHKTNIANIIQGVEPMIGKAKIQKNKKSTNNPKELA